MVKKPFESRVQDLVYNIDVGIGLRLIQVGVVTLMILGLLLMFSAIQFRGLKDADAMEMAQLGKNLADHKSFLTQCVRPSTMQILQQGPLKNASVDRHPDILHAPVYPALLAAGFSLFKGAFSPDRRGGVFTPEQWIIIPLNHLFVLATGVFVYLCARRLFSLRIALMTVVSFFLSRLVWDDSISGLGIPVVGFFCLGSIYFALRVADAVNAGMPARRWIFSFLFSAGFAGMAVLTRYAALALLPGILLYLGFAFRRRAAAWIPLFLVIVAALLTPWLMRNRKVSGAFWGAAPRTALHNSGLSDGDAIDRTMKAELKPGDVVRKLQSKFITRATHLLREDLDKLGEGLLLPFFFVAFFFRFVRREVHLFRWGLALSMITLFLTSCLFDNAFRLMHIFWPLAIAYGYSFFSLLLDRLQFQLRLARLAVTGLVMASSALPFAFAFLPPRPGIPYPPYIPLFVSHVSGLLEPTEVMCTDMPWATAWYGDRTSIYLPQSLDEFYEINDYYKGIKGLYFTTLTRDQPYARSLRTGPYKTWFPILEGRIPNDFPLTQGFPLNNLDQLFLSDRVRWAPR
jgi:hypothetical protein